MIKRWTDRQIGEVTKRGIYIYNMINIRYIVIHRDRYRKWACG